MAVGRSWERPPKATRQAGQLILIEHPLRLAESCVPSSLTRTLLYAMAQLGAKDMSWSLDVIESICQSSKLRE